MNNRNKTRLYQWFLLGKTFPIIGTSTRQQISCLDVCLTSMDDQPEAGKMRWNCLVMRKKALPQKNDFILDEQINHNRGGKNRLSSLHAVN